MIPEERPFSFQCDGLRLEGMVHEGEGSLAAVVLHPHPLYGGDMDNHVVLAIRSALAEAGATTVRFNFRGTGGSKGVHDGGRGEANDARAAIGALRELRPGCRLVLAGYSFGAQVAAGVAATDTLAGLVLVSPPLAMGAGARLPEGVPTLLVTGDADEVAPADAVRALAGPRCRVAIVEGVSHAWWPGVDRLSAEVRAFLRELPQE